VETITVDVVEEPAPGGHLAPSFIVDAIRAGAPRFAASSDTTVVPMRKGS
jgi:hypothetical protein